MERYFAYFMEVLSRPESDLWKQNQQGGFGWFFVKASSKTQSQEFLEVEMQELGYSVREIVENFEVKSESDLDDEEHTELFALLKSDEWNVQYRTLDTYPFNSIE